MESTTITKSLDNTGICKQPVRILHVFAWFNQGGIENFIMNVYRNIDRSKIQFDFAFPINKKGYFDEEVNSLGGRIYFFDSEKISVGNYYRNLKRIINDYGPYTVVHSHVYYYSGIVLLIARLCGINIRIAHSHDTVKGRKPTLLRKLYEKIMRRAIKINATDLLSCSNLAGQYVFGNKSLYKVLYNGIDLDRFSFKQKNRIKIRKDLGISDEHKLILNVGRFTEQKNHDFLIEVFKEILDRNLDYRLLMIGTGPLEDEIRGKIEAYGFLDKCFFLHNIQNTEDYYCASDVFLLPSRYEGMGIVCMEAQATGLPSLLSTEVPKEISVTDIVHYLNLNDSVGEWASEVMALANKSVKRNNYSERLRDTSFDVDRTVMDLTNIYLRDQ